MKKETKRICIGAGIGAVVGFIIPAFVVGIASLGESVPKPLFQLISYTFGIPLLIGEKISPSVCDSTFGCWGAISTYISVIIYALIGGLIAYFYYKKK